MAKPTDHETKDYQAEVRRLRAERIVAAAEPDTPEKPKRLTLSQIVELLLTRSAGEQSSVALSRSASGETQIDVKVRTGSDGDVQAVEDAERKAVEVYARLAEQYPPLRDHDNASVTLARNAKGETQVEVKGATSHDGAATLDALTARIMTAYDSARMRYPMADGNSAKQGSVA